MAVRRVGHGASCPLLRPGRPCGVPRRLRLRFAHLWKREPRGIFPSLFALDLCRARSKANPPLSPFPTGEDKRPCDRAHRAAPAGVGMGVRRVGHGASCLLLRPGRPCGVPRRLRLRFAPFGKGGHGGFALRSSLLVAQGQRQIPLCPPSPKGEDKRPCDRAHRAAPASVGMAVRRVAHGAWCPLLRPGRPCGVPRRLRLRFAPFGKGGHGGFALRFSLLIFVAQGQGQIPLCPPFPKGEDKRAFPIREDKRAFFKGGTQRAPDLRHWLRASLPSAPARLLPGA